MPDITHSRNTRQSTRHAVISSGLVILAIAVGGPMLALQVRRAGSLNWNDFGTFHRAACSGVLYGDDPLSPSVGASRARNLNPPHFHLLILPTCAFSTRTVYALWMLASGIGFIWGARLTARARGDSPPLVAFVAVLLSAATMTLVLTGQVTAIVGVALVHAWYADRRGRSWHAGLWFGLVVATKPFVAPIALWWLVRRDWKALVASATSALASILAGVLIFGWPNVEAWVRELRAVSWPWVAMNASAWAPWARLFGNAPYFVPWTIAPEIQFVGTLVSVTVIGAITAIAVVRTTNRDKAWALCLMAALLISPLGATYYAWWVLPPAAQLSVPRWAWMVAAVTWFLSPYEVVAFSQQVPAFTTATIGSVYTAGLLVVWAATVWKAERLPSAPPRAPLAP